MICVLLDIVQNVCVCVPSVLHCALCVCYALFVDMLGRFSVVAWV